MDRTIVYEIPIAYEGHKVSEFLKSKGYSAKLLTKLKKQEEFVQVDHTPCYLNHLLESGEQLQVIIREERSSEKIPPVQLPFPIVYEDEDMVVVNKPYGMPIHPSMKNYENTLGNAAAYYFRQYGDDFVYRCINRLDRDTSGLTIIAKNLLSAGLLYEQMEQRKIHRVYTAITEGILEPKQGTISLPLGRKPGSAIERMVDITNGEPAITHYRTIATNGVDKSLIQVQLETGRTHQIRVHMSYMGHPLLGDFLYNPHNHEMERQALHAGSLSFTHPISGMPMSFAASLPEDMQRIVQNEFRK